MISPRPTTEQLADEIDLLAPEAVGGAATRLLVAVVALGRYAYDRDRDLRHMIEPLVTFHEALAGYVVERKPVPGGGQDRSRYGVAGNGVSRVGTDPP